MKCFSKDEPFPCYPQNNLNSRGFLILGGHTVPRFELIRENQVWLREIHLRFDGKIVFFTLIQILRINSEVNLLAETMLEEFRGNKSEALIGVHVRRTDYKDLLGKSTISTLLTYYYLASINIKNNTITQQIRVLFK